MNYNKNKPSSTIYELHFVDYKICNCDILCYDYVAIVNELLKTNPTFENLCLKSIFENIIKL